MQLARRAFSRAARENRKQNRRENGDYGDDNEQFYQREGFFSVLVKHDYLDSGATLFSACRDNYRAPMLMEGQLEIKFGLSLL